MRYQRFNSPWLLSASLLFLSAAAKDTLKINSFTDCQSDADIKLEKVDIEYDKDLRSVIFDVAGSSSKAQNVTATLKVEAYGKDVYSKKFNPCDSSTFVAGLCPVPTGKFAAASQQTIPAEYADKIPSVAFSIPDVAIQATLELKRLEDGENVGCVVADLQNGKSINSEAVTLIAVGVVGAALVISGATAALSALSSGGQPGERGGSSPGFQSMVGWFQNIATAGMMSVTYPSVYQGFTTRFAFSTGLITWTGLQGSIHHFRSMSGGNTVNKIETLQKTSSRLMVRQFTSNSSTPINPEITKALGIQKFVEESGIVQENAFMTVFLITMIIISSIAVGILLFKCILEAWAMFGSFPKSLAGFRKHFWGTIFRTIVQLIYLIWPIWVLFSIYQFRTSDSWGPTLLAGISLAIFAGILIFFITKIWLTARQLIKTEGSAARLFEDKMVWLKYSIFYDNLHRNSWWFFAPLIAYGFCRSVFMAALNGRGLPQTIAILSLDIIMLGALIFIRPFEGKVENVVHILMQITRVIMMAAVLIFVDEMKVERSTQTVLGFVLVILTSVMTIIFVLLMLFSSIYQCCKKNPHRQKRKEAERRQKESEYFLDPRHKDTSYNPHGHQLEEGTNRPPHPRFGSYSQVPLVEHPIYSNVSTQRI